MVPSTSESMDLRCRRQSDRGVLTFPRPTCHTATCLGPVDEEYISEFIAADKCAPDASMTEYGDIGAIDSFRFYDDQFAGGMTVTSRSSTTTKARITNCSWRTRTSDGWTRTMCAEKCLAYEDCTGFEYPNDSEYCALYYDWSCDMSGLPILYPPRVRYGYSLRHLHLEKRWRCRRHRCGRHRCGRHNRFDHGMRWREHFPVVVGGRWRL